MLSNLAALTDKPPAQHLYLGNPSFSKRTTLIPFLASSSANTVPAGSCTHNDYIKITLQPGLHQIKAFIKN